LADEDVIRAQIPGIFYRRPDPESEPFVQEGEVMKQFHEVTSEIAGTIAAFEVENEGMVSPGDVVARLTT
jgi:acetyl-CoA carboxylase biotin carboxyl carrier protein